MKRRILDQCLREARAANIAAWPTKMRHFSFVVQDARATMGVNRNGSPIAGFGYGKHYPQNIHAEPNAYRRAKQSLDLSRAWDVVNVRLSKAGEVRISAPCPCCTAFLSAMGCRNVIFTTAAGWATLIL